MSSPGVSSSDPVSRRQKRMGPAPFASFEDLSDELDSPEDKTAASSVIRLPGIREDVTPSTPSRVDQIQPEFTYIGVSLIGAPAVTPTLAITIAPQTPPSTTISSVSTPPDSLSTKMSLQTPSTPRIDISRASSSSHHEDSRDSTPERELFEGHEGGGTKLGLGFKEEGTLDLRSSTEELDFQDHQEKSKTVKTRPQSPSLQDDSNYHRKDSQSSEIGLLCISGRTSRLSSVGSQGSAQSRLSNASHLSIISGQSVRSPSPHKMLLETSFCGHKARTSTQHVLGHPGTKIESDVLEKVLLAREHDPREVILAEGISVEPSPTETNLKINAFSEKSVKISASALRTNKSDITITISDSNNLDKPNIPRTFISPSGVEYTYIPLKGPLPKDDTLKDVPKTRPREIKSATANHSKPSVQSKNKNVIEKGKSKSASTSPLVQKTKHTFDIQSPIGDEPKYIRIKLKPDYMYQDESTPKQGVKKPVCLDLNEPGRKPFQSFTQVISKTSNELPNSSSKCLGNQLNQIQDATSPKPTRHKTLRDTPKGSKTPSPCLSRRSSFTSIFRGREVAGSPESPTIPGLKRKNTFTGILKDATESIKEKTRSRSKSRDRDRTSISTGPSSTESIDSKTKQPKSVLSLFKPKIFNAKQKPGRGTPSPEIVSNIEGIGTVEFKFTAESPVKKYYETPLHCESIRIPLHSPSHYEGKPFLEDFKSSSQESQETVIDTTKCVDAIIEQIPEYLETKVVPELPELINRRQSSTGSENVVFCTKLGSDNELFTTNLPKEKSGNTPSLEKQCDKSHIDVSQKLIENMNTNAFSAIDNTPNIVTCEEVTSNSPICNKEGDFEKNASKNEANFLSENGKAARSVFLTSSFNDERCSSESEKDSEFDYLKTKDNIEEKPENEEPERKGLVYQNDSYEDELPYVPTTLPLERSVAAPILPVKQRCTFEMKTYPIDRPRSTTPINLSTLDDYCEDIVGAINPEHVTKTIEKLKICLPRDESVDRPNKSKSPRKPATTANWFAFGDKSSQKRTSPLQGESEAPPLPPKGVQKEWINFEEIPERRKPPTRIQTIPSRSNIEVAEVIVQENVIYSYVNPEDCKCECHEIAREREQKQIKQQSESAQIREEELPLLDDDPGEDEKSSHENRIKVDIAISDRASVISDSSVDLSISAEHHASSNMEASLRTPFTGDLEVSSNRSSILFQDEPHSPTIAMNPTAF